MNILVNCNGFIGDILFASSLAKKLKEKHPGCHVTYVIPLVQPKLLLEANPYIDEVYVANLPVGPRGAERVYRQVINIPVVDQRYPATVYMQAMAGIEDQSTEFDVYVPNEILEKTGKEATYLRTLHPDQPLVAYQRNWDEKSFEFSVEEYERAVDVPNLGYGGRHRTSSKIIDALKPHFLMFATGFGNGVTQHSSDAANERIFAYTAGIIKHCDYFIGSEGGLSNLAAAVGTKCIITTDFIHQLYGPKGVIKQIEEPQMGPAVYYPEAGHVHLDPYLTDEQVAEAIKEHIHNDFHHRAS